MKDEILTKIDEKFNGFKIAIIAEIWDEIKQEISEALENIIKKREEMVCMLPLSETSEWVEEQSRRIRTVWQTVLY